MHAVDSALAALGADHRAPAPGEWGLTLDDVAGRALHVGLRETAGPPALLRMQACACDAAWAPDPHWLLHRGRLGELVRYTHSAAGDVWVQAELPSAALSPELVERVLARLVVAAEEARYAARRRATSR